MDSLRLILLPIAISVTVPLSIMAQEGPRSAHATTTYLGQLATVQSQSHRCLSAVIYTLAHEFGIPLSFEDAPIMFPGDYDDITSPAYHPKSDEDHLLVPRGGRLVITFSVPSTRKPPANIDALLKTLLNSYMTAGYPGIYGIRKIDDVWHVIPTQARDAKGIMKNITPLMDTRIRLEPKLDRTNQEVFAEAFSEIERLRGRRVFIGTRLGNRYLATRSPEGIEGTVREILERTFNQFGGHQLWLLQCTPRSGPCALNIL